MSDLVSSLMKLSFRLCIQDLQMEKKVIQFHVTIFLITFYFCFNQGALVILFFSQDADFSPLSGNADFVIKKITFKLHNCTWNLILNLAFSIAVKLETDFIFITKIDHQNDSHLFYMIIFSQFTILIVLHEISNIPNAFDLIGMGQFYFYLMILQGKVRMKFLLFKAHDLSYPSQIILLIFIISLTYGFL